jgi:glycosyltransferase involved in cell wall biosynthesis
MDTSKPAVSFVTLGFDWRNIAEDHFDEILSKSERDRLEPAVNTIFYILWADQTNYIKRENIQIQQMRSLVKRNKVILDVVLIWMIPFVLLRRKYRPDYFFVSNFSAAAAAYVAKRLFGAKTVLCLSSCPRDLMQSRTFPKIRSLYYRFFEAIAPYTVDVFLANGPAPKQYIIDAGITTNIGLVHKNTLAKDLPHIKAAVPGTAYTRHHIDKDTHIILAVGRLEEEKAYPELIAMFAELRNRRSDVVLLICGEGTQRTRIEEAIQTHNVADAVILAGQVSREDIWGYYLDASIFVHVSESEGNPNAVKEAMYMGVPVVTRAILATEHLLGTRGDRGYLCHADTLTDDFIHAVQMLLDDTQTRQDIIKNAKQYIDEQFSNNTKYIRDFL